MAPLPNRSATRWLTDDQQRAWRAYVAMQSRLNAQLNRELQAGSELSLADYDVLVRLTEAPAGRLRIYELGQGLEWEQSRLSHHLTRMQRRKLVAREDCPDDRRGAFIVVTADGRRALADAAPDHVESVRRLLFDHLSTAQVTTLEQVATAVLDRLDASV